MPVDRSGGYDVRPDHRGRYARWLAADLEQKSADIAVVRVGHAIAGRYGNVLVAARLVSRRMHRVVMMRAMRV